MGSLIISSQQQHDFQEKYYVSLFLSHELNNLFYLIKGILTFDFQFRSKQKVKHI
jgi:hypothetical protein